MKNILFCLFLIAFSFPSFSHTFERKGNRVGTLVFTNFEEENNFEVLVQLNMLDGWHISGPQESDIGKPTVLEILPAADFNQTPIFSEPTEFVFDDIIKISGYADKTYIYTSFKPQNNIDYKVKISWLACKDYCEEESVEFNLPTKNLYSEKLWEQNLLQATKTFEKQKEKFSALSFLSVILFSFIAGIILNFMPCIFPILSIKAIYVAKNGKKRHIKRRILSAVGYTLGVLLSFLSIASILYFMRKNGESVGWGFQLQSPLFVGFMLILFCLIFLMFLDVITLPQAKFGKMSQKNSFLTGFFAVLIASPCSGPFMGMAIGYALLQPLYLYYPIFASLAVGYALPFALLDIFPQIIARILPKSGKWMINLKRILSVPVFLTILWLGWVLCSQLHNIKSNPTNWQTYSKSALENAIKEKRPILLNFTAKWCLTCLLNEKSTFESEKFKKAAEENNLVLLKADWTNKDEEIFAELEKYNRSSVPLYVYYNEDGKYTLLPQILTPDTIIAYIK